MIRTYYLGATLVARRSVPPAPVPANYTNEVKIREKAAENAAEAMRVSMRIPTAGDVRAFILLDDTGEVVCQSDPDGIDTPFVESRRLMNFLIKEANIITAGGTLGGPQEEPGAAIVGFCVHDIIRVAALATLIGNVQDRETPALAVPPVFYRGEEMLYDPYTTLLHTDTRRLVPLRDLLSVFGLPVTDEELGVPLIAATTAYKLSQRAGLFWPQQ